MAGFDFDNHLRNNALANKNLHLPKAVRLLKLSLTTDPRLTCLTSQTSTGTTIVGCLFDGGIILGADTRATEGPIVADKNCEKIHYITDNIRCCGAGTAADTEFTTALISSNMALHALSTGRQPMVVTAMTMLKQMLFKHQGQIGAALVLGGFDSTGPNLFTIAPHGSTDKLPYVTMGSGSLAAMAVFESYWKPNLSRAEAIDMVCEAIEAGIFNDLGSGSNVDVCVIEKEKTEMMRNYRTPNQKVAKAQSYKWRRGVTAWTKEEVTKFKVVGEEVIVAGGIVAGPEGSGAGAGASAMEIDA
ncbi:20S proteasome subunit beta 2, partial [Phenoliferia sp. Uapishka_3]